MIRPSFVSMSTWGMDIDDVVEYLNRGQVSLDVNPCLKCIELKLESTVRYKGSKIKWEGVSIILAPSDARALAKKLNDYAKED